MQHFMTSRNLLLLLVSTAGAASGALLLPGLSLSELPGVLALTAVAAATELLGTALFAERTRVSGGWIAVLAAGMLFGPAAAVLPAAAVAFGYLARRRPLSRVAFNFGHGMVAAAAAILAYEAITRELAVPGEAVLAAVVAGLLLWAISTLLVSGMVALDTHSDFFKTLGQNFGWLPLHFGAGGVIALALANAWEAQGLLGLAAFVLPILGFALALRQGTSKACPAIVEARAARQNATELQRLLKQRDALAEELRTQAFHDSLTGLPNRALFFDRLQQAFDAAHRQESWPSLAFIDLDRFKSVNDRLGHGAGDRVLREAANRIRAVVAPSDTVARYGGDEFIVLLQSARDPEEAERAAGRILSALSAPLEVQGASTTIAASIGLAHWQPSDSDINEFLRRSDIALYRAKKEGRGRVIAYNDFADHDPLLRRDLEQDLTRALQRDELFVEYQPLVDLDTRRVTGFEALVRWQHPERGLIEPGAFIPLAEETGQIVALGEQVLAKACAAAMTWQPVPETGSAPRVSVNVSPLQLSLPDFVATVQRALEDSRLAPDRLTLEVTESAVLSDFDAATRTLGQLKELGIRIALDNFGTGYSSMSYLHQLPIDVLKLDRSFVPDLASDDRLRSIVGSLHQVARTLGLMVVAEGVEREEDVSILRSMGCQLGQGFHLGRPMPEDAARMLLMRGLEHRTEALYAAA